MKVNRIRALGGSGAVRRFDLAIVGGGLSGCAIADSMSRAGASVILFERSTQFRDRVRGDGLAPWGVSELHRLGLNDAFMAAGARELEFWDVWDAGQKLSRVQTSLVDPHAHGVLSFHHARMQEALMESARSNGVEVIRPASPSILSANSSGSLISEGSQVYECKLIVGADGLHSSVRSRMGKKLHSAPKTHYVTGCIVRAAGIDPSAVATSRLEDGRLLAIPLGRETARVYRMQPQRPRGANARKSFETCLETIVDPHRFISARAVGPFASFRNSDSWVEGPFGPGYVLAGDAAGRNDPSIGQGMAIALRDARELTERLKRDEAWESACASYATARAKYSSVHRIVAACGWLADKPGPEGRRIRQAIGMGENAKARDALMARIRSDPADVPSDSETARCLLGGIDPPQSALAGNSTVAAREAA